MHSFRPNSVSTFVVTLSDESITPNEYGWYFADGFEGDTCDWNIRGADQLLQAEEPHTLVMNHC